MWSFRRCQGLLRPKRPLRDSTLPPGRLCCQLHLAWQFLGSPPGVPTLAFRDPGRPHNSTPPLSPEQANSALLPGPELSEPWNRVECTAPVSPASPPLADPWESSESRALWVPELGVDPRSTSEPSLDSRMRRKAEAPSSLGTVHHPVPDPPRRRTEWAPRHRGWRGP